MACVVGKHLDGSDVTVYNLDEARSYDTVTTPGTYQVRRIYEGAAVQSEPFVVTAGPAAALRVRAAPNVAKGREWRAIVQVVDACGNTVHEARPVRGCLGSQSHEVRADAGYATLDLTAPTACGEHEATFVSDGIEARRRVRVADEARSSCDDDLTGPELSLRLEYVSELASRLDALARAEEARAQASERKYLQLATAGEIRAKRPTPDVLAAIDTERNLIRRLLATRANARRPPPPRKLDDDWRSDLNVSLRGWDAVRATDARQREAFRALPAFCGKGEILPDLRRRLGSEYQKLLQGETAEAPLRIAALRRSISQAEGEETRRLQKVRRDALEQCRGVLRCRYAFLAAIDDATGYEPQQGPLDAIHARWQVPAFRSLVDGLVARFNRASGVADLGLPHNLYPLCLDPELRIDRGRWVRVAVAPHLPSDDAALVKTCLEFRDPYCLSLLYDMLRRTARVYHVDNSDLESQGLVVRLRKFDACCEVRLDLSLQFR